MQSQDKQTTRPTRDDRAENHKGNDRLNTSSQELYLTGGVLYSLGQFRTGEGCNEDSADAHGTKMSREERFSECLDVRNPFVKANDDGKPPQE